MTEREQLFLEVARRASTLGHHAFACELYERAVSAPDGFEGLRVQWGAEAVAAALEAVRLPGDKIKGIKFIRERASRTLADSKELIEAVMGVNPSHA